MSTRLELPVMILIVLVLVLAGCVATGVLNIPLWIVDSPYTTVIMVILSLGGFSKNPMLGVSIFLLTAVMLFYRNVRKTASKLQNFVPTNENDEPEPFFDTPLEARKESVLDAISSSPSNDVLEPSQSVDNTPSDTLNTFLNQHRAASDGSAVNRSLGVYGEEMIPKQAHKPAGDYSTFVSSPRGVNQFSETSGVVEGFTSESASFSDLGTPTDGQYPILESRASSSPDSREYTYRPDADTGSNTFERIGPDLDEKKEVFKYK